MKCLLSDIPANQNVRTGILAPKHYAIDNASIFLPPPLQH